MDLLQEYVKDIASVARHFLKWFLLAIVSGTLVGIFISFFLNSLQYVTNLREHQPWLLYLLPFGGAFVSYLYLKFGKDSAKGNNLIIERINEGVGEIPFRMAPLVFLGTVVTHLFGGSAGREGTGVQIGASICSKLSHFLHLNKEDATILIISGVSSGFGVVFGTPIAGTIFGLEVSTIGKMRYESIIPCLLSSYIGTYVSTLFNVSHSHYEMETLSSQNPFLFYKVMACSILFGLMSKLFAELTHYLKKIFSDKLKKSYVKSFVGGLIIIGLMLMIRNRMYLGLSLPLLKEAFESPVVGYAFLIKLLLTSITLATGFQGGEVTPLFVVGATFGNFLAPLFNLPLSFVAGLGMIGVFCGGTKTPLASFAMGLELFGGGNLKYFFITCVISYVFAGKSGIYTSQKVQSDR